MQNLCETVGITPIFVEAIYGKELSAEKIQHCHNEEDAIASINRPLARGEIGCTLSHLAIFKKMLPMQAGDVQSTYASIDDLITDFNYRPSTNIESGVKLFVSWYKEYYGTQK